jgi:1,4-dihydroxy-2-naphthoate octaprenyltransferase
MTSGALPSGSPSGVRLWWLAARPRTLPLALAPVAVGTAVAHVSNAASWAPALAAALGALLLQIGANFANDLFDAEKGADDADRIGPPRAVQMGWVTPFDMRRATMLAFAAAGFVGAYLVGIGGWPVAAIGVLSIATAIAYTGGPWPLGYHGLGEAAVLVFFGFVAVGGTCYVQTLTLPAAALVAAIPVGALASAVLVVNNLRDVEGDRRAGKRTLAVRLGRAGARAEFVALLGAAFATPIAMWVGGQGAPVLLPLLALPRALVLARSVCLHEDGPRLNATLAGTAALALVFSALFAIGLAASA